MRGRSSEKSTNCNSERITETTLWLLMEVYSVLIAVH